MNAFANTKSMIIVLAMPGCPACEDYKPRFERQVDGFRSYKVPFEWYRSGSPKRGVIPVLIVDATSADPNIQAFCDQSKISGMPTTLLLSRNRPTIQLEGALDDQQIYELLNSAILANR